MVYSLSSDLVPPLQAQGAAGVRVDIEARPVATANVQPDAVALPEDVGCGVKLEDELVDLAGGH